jgi:hypothetical protein
MTKAMQTVLITLGILTATTGATVVAQDQVRPTAVTTATFEPVYRASKALQGATTSGVTFVRFGELMQTFSTEIGIAKDHPLNDADKKLLPLYEQAFIDYQFSAALWHLKIECMVKFQGTCEPVLWVVGMPAVNDTLKLAETYDLPITERTSGIGMKYKSVPESSIQTVWTHADKTLGEATTMFYGNQPAK